MTEHPPAQPDPNAPGAPTPHDAPQPAYPSYSPQSYQPQAGADPRGGGYPAYGSYAPYGYGQPPQYTQPMPGSSPAPGPSAYPPPAERPAGNRHTLRTAVLSAVIAAVVGGGVGAATVAIADNNNSKSTSSGLVVQSGSAAPSLKVDGLSNLTAATFGQSDSLVVGQTVVAVGAPLGLSDTVTSGIVSNTSRPVTTGDANSEAVFNAVQTDAAINPGNSGGPLVDLNGNVVGINAAIATPNTGGLNIPGQQQQESGSIGIGFAIPADEASRIASELITNGKATHAVIGVSVGGSNSQSQPSQTGAVISSVDANGPAASAGLQAGDVVTSLGGQRLEDATALRAAVRSHAPGEKVDLTYLRGGKSTTVSVTLGSAGS